MRYATLIAYKLPSHPLAREPENRAGLRAADKTLPFVLDQLELLKPRIEARYNSWQKAMERRREANTAIENDRLNSRSQIDLAATDPAVAGNPTTLGAAENSDLAVQLAHNEIRRRETKRRAIQQGSISAEDEQERRTAGQWAGWEAALSKGDQSHYDDEMRRNMEASRRRLDGPQDFAPGPGERRLPKPPRPARPSARDGNGEYRYPSIQKSQPLQYDDTFESSRTSSPGIKLPPKPPKERFEGPMHISPPSLPDKIPSENQDVSASKLPATNFTFRPSAYLENGNPLRTVFLPPTLRLRFLEVAESNTRNNLETCGMLCGTLISNALFISKLVIPEQESTSDTCETINESAFFDYCAAEDLMVLGWIHTHPTQTCFMSSRDLHTHCGYQIMMPESIAIVCAPSKTPA